MARGSSINANSEVLVIGASGGIGTAAVQLAAHVGARVTAVCSAENAEMVKALGATRTIDYTAEDFTEAGERYDIVFDTVGKSSYFRCRGSLKERGRYLVTLGRPKAYLQTLLTGAFSKRRCIYGMSVEKKGALREVHRQFVTRTSANRDVVIRLEAFLSDYFESGRSETEGLPSVRRCASGCIFSIPGRGV